MRTRWSPLVPLVLLAACGGGSQGPVEPNSGSPIASRYQECWTAYLTADDDELARCFTDAAVSQVFGVSEVGGPSAIVPEHAKWRAAFPGAQSDAQLVLVAGRNVFAVRWYHGIHNGPLKTPMGEIKPTAKPVSLLLGHRVRFADDKRIEREQLAFDLLTLGNQLGVSLAPARAPVAAAWPGAPHIVFAEDSPTERANAKAVRTAYTRFNQRDLAFDTIYAEDIIDTNLAEAEDTVGKQALQAKNETFRTAFGDLHIDVEEVWSAGDYTVAYEHVRGTHTSALGAIVATGQSMDLEVIELLEWKGGKIVHRWLFGNGYQLLDQLSTHQPKQ